jgi:hypothetical protein
MFGVDQTRDRNHGWKGGRIKCNGFWLIPKPDHHEADKNGYVKEHRIIYAV